MNLAGKLEWKMTDHICRQCFGRVLVRYKSATKQFVLRCACCGAQADGNDEHVICCCGYTLADAKDMGVRCQANDARSSEWLPEIVAKVQEPKS